MSAPAHSHIDNIYSAKKAQKALATFANCLCIARAGKGGIQTIRLSKMEETHEFLNIKNVSHDEMMAMNRVPHQPMEFIPSNTGGFVMASKVFVRNELLSALEYTLD